MSSCPRTTRARAAQVKRDLDSCETITGVVVLDPNAGPHAEWTLEATVTGDRLPAEAVSVLGDHGCAVVSTTLRAPGVTQAVVAL